MAQHSDPSDIPPVFRREEGAQHHSHCKVCNRELLEQNLPYCIEKVFRFTDYPPGKQSIFDFAICIDCMDEMRKSLSEESRSSLMAFYQEKLRDGLQEQEHYDYREDKCFFTRRSIREGKSYQMIAFCQGYQLKSQEPPLIVSEEILEEASDRLSAQTIEALDDFTQRNFGWPPELARLMDEGKFALV